MLTAGFNLEQRIVDLARIDIDGQLAELLQQYSVDCRGMTSDAGQLHTANELIHCDVVAKALSVLFDLPDKQCIDAAKRVLLRHPRRDAALALIDEYMGRTQPKSNVTPVATESAPGFAGGLIQGLLTATEGASI